MLPKGCYVALVTPMKSDHTVDFEALNQLIQWHLNSGTQALVILGTTGEASTITVRERARIIETTVKQVRGQIPVIVGAGTHSTDTTCEYIQEAALLGADAALLTTPYYNCPTQNGLYNHFYEASRSSKLPLILYNIPKRTGVDLEPYTVQRLAEDCSSIIGIKEATGSLERLKALRQILSASFLILGGNDDLIYPFMQHGGDGIISVVANVVPEHMLNLCHSIFLNEHSTTQNLLDSINPLIQALSVETNPIPVKRALYFMKKIESGIRLPLTPLSSEYELPIKDALGQLGLFNAVGASV